MFSFLLFSSQSFMEVAKKPDDKKKKKKGKEKGKRTSKFRQI